MPSTRTGPQPYTGGNRRNKRETRLFPTSCPSKLNAIKSWASEAMTIDREVVRSLENRLAGMTGRLSQLRQLSGNDSVSEATKGGLQDKGVPSLKSE